MKIITLSTVAALWIQGAALHADPAIRVFYTQNDLEKDIPAQPVKEYACGADAVPAEVTLSVYTKRRFQTIAGVGAAFSETGSLAFATLSVSQQKELLTHLFDQKSGAGFSFCRLPVGASDFVVSPYSYSETPEDYELKAFSLARDEKSIIPVVLAARRINPELKLAACPWSPPGWMKVSGKMVDGSHLRDEDRIYKTYALYFEKYLRGYQAAGIPVSRLSPQNEMDLGTNYASCVMPPEQVIKFVTKYLAPQFAAAKIPTEIWAGTFRESLSNDFAFRCMQSSDFRKAVTGLAIQYFKGNAVDLLSKQYSGLRLMHSEADCYNGANSVQEAQKRFGEISNIFNVGCDNYLYWNMLLDENHWNMNKWTQNSLVIIDRNSHTVRYNPDYQPVYLVGRFVRPGSVCVYADLSRAKDSQFRSPLSAFVRPDGSVMAMVQNTGGAAVQVDLKIDGDTNRVQLPPHADCIIVREPAK